jgi:hypothetical protein
LRSPQVGAFVMAVLMVITGLDQLPPTERWPRLVAPLAEELAYSGFGDLPDLDSLRREVDECKSLQATDLAVNLVNFDYGRPLVDRVVEAAGIKRGKPVCPVRWCDFNCADYFSSGLAEHGYWDEPGQYWYIWPAERVYEDSELQFLVIGSAGVDGIDWGYRRGHSGLWAWFPIDAEFVALAPTTDALLQGWLSGAITV